MSAIIVYSSTSLISTCLPRLSHPARAILDERMLNSNDYSISISLFFIPMGISEDDRQIDVQHERIDQRIKRCSIPPYDQHLFHKVAKSELYGMVDT
jgi:hypothetical protein